MPREKIKFALWMKPETQLLVRDVCPRDNCKSQSEFIEKAIHFYAGHVETKNSLEPRGSGTARVAPDVLS